MTDSIEDRPEFSVLKVRFGGFSRSSLQSGEFTLSADSVEKHTFAGAEFRRLSWARAPFLSGFSRLLRCGKDLGQFAEVLGGGGEEEFVICTAWTT